MKLVELAFPAAATDSDARARARALCEALGKTAVEVPDLPGFVVNRLLFPYLFSAVAFMEETGMAPEDVDTCMTLGAGHPMGPLALLDFVGLDVAVAIGDAIGADVPERLRALVAEGALGRKSGRGLYDHLTMRVYRIPYSTNVERVALALAHKSIAVEWVDVDPDDRSAVVALTARTSCRCWRPTTARSSPTRCASCAGSRSAGPIRRCGPPSPARRAEVDVFVEWFNRVWKVPPNAMAAELAAAEPDQQRLHDLSDELRGWLHLFEELLDGRDYLMGDAFGAADICAFPFLKYGVLDAAPRRHTTPSTGCSASTCRSPAPSPRSRPGCTASTPSRALELILRATFRAR